jgi:hypothetical protein
VVFRLVTLSPVAAILAVAGIALADEAGIIDPWDASLSGWFTAPAPPAADIARAGTPSVPVRSGGFAAAAVPGDHEIVVEPWKPAPFELSYDPWVVSRPRPAAPAATARSRSHGKWAYVVDEIIDPWGHSTGRVSRDPLIVDPWAR